MSYSSICGADNVLGGLAGDLYFHAGNRQQIATYTQTGGGSACGMTVATGNVSAAVPEPGTWAMLFVGFFALGAVLRSAKRRERIAVTYA